MKLQLTFFLVTLLSTQLANAQQTPYFNFTKGSGLTAPDSSFSMNTRFRMQNRFGFITESEDDLNIRVCLFGFSNK